MPRKTRSVLIVDDNPTARTVVTHLIRKDPRFRVRAVARDGVEALDLTADGCPDLIVLDNEMPRMTGLQVLPLLRERCPDARIVVWSMDESVKDAAVAAGGDGWIDKSAPLDHLLDWLRAA